MWHGRSAGAQVCGTWDDLCLRSRYIVQVFQDTLSATAQRTTGLEETELVEPITLRPAGTIRTSQSRWLPAVTVLSPQAHRSTPSHISHVLLSSFSKCPAQPPMLSSSSSPPLPGRPSSPCSPQHHLAGSHNTKESPLKSSSHPTSRKVSLPAPQMKGTDVKLMPHLISARKLG